VTPPINEKKNMLSHPVENGGFRISKSKGLQYFCLDWRGKARAIPTSTGSFAVLDERSRSLTDLGASCYWLWRGVKTL